MNENQSSLPQPIAYATPVARRPGIMTAVGIISIVVGSLSALASIYGVLAGLMYILMAQMSFPLPPSPAATTAPASTVTPFVTTIAPTMPPATTPVGPSNYSVSTSSSSWSTTSPGAGAVTVTTSTAAAPTFSMKVDTGASVLVIAESILSIGVAVLLIIAGSLLLRDSAKSLRLHRLYVLVKIPLILAAAVGTWWTFTSLMTGMSTALSPAAPPPMAGFGNMVGLFQAGFGAIIALIYPIALLIVLSTKTAKTYFNQIANLPA